MSASYRTPTHTNIFTAQGANATSTVVVPVTDFMNIQLSVKSSGNATAVLRIKGSTQQAQPTFTAAQAVANQWDYVAFYDYATGALTAGATGYAFTAADRFGNLLINVDGLNWLTCEISGWAAGLVTVDMSAMTNQ